VLVREGCFEECTQRFRRCCTAHGLLLESLAASEPDRFNALVFAWLRVDLVD
jgi:hypothetical protein